MSVSPVLLLSLLTRDYSLKERERVVGTEEGGLKNAV